MKHIISLVFAGAVGALVTIGSFKYLEKDKVQSQTQITGITPVSAHNTLHTPSVPVSVPADFVFAAEVARKAVVEIKAVESDKLAQQRRDERSQQDPWSKFFDFGDDFYNPFSYRYPRQGAGSGVVISPEGYVVTNNHVVDFADQVLVRTLDGNEYEADIIGRDPSTDLAVLKINSKNLSALEFGNSDEVKVGEWVLAVGNPFEYLTSTVTAGIISAKGRDIDLIKGEKTIEEFLQTDAAINPGNSGGALVDSKGRLIGINTAIASQTGNYAGYSFAIPVNLMSKIVTDIIEHGGDIERTSLGVIVEPIDAEYAAELGLGVDKGLRIDEIINGSPAQYAGLLPNDVIVEVNGKEITSFDQLKDIINYAKVGDILNVKVWRKGNFETIPVRLRKRL